MAAKWSVVCEPEGKNPGVIDKAKAAVKASEGANVGGIVIYVTQGSDKQEVSRVAFIRRNSKNPKASFDRQLAAEIDKAKAAAETLNGLFADAGERL